MCIRCRDNVSNGRILHQTQTDGRELMEYVVEVGSGAIMYTYIPSFIKTGSGISRLMGWEEGYTENMMIA
jgi:hypothetical protein